MATTEIRTPSSANRQDATLPSRIAFIALGGLLVLIVLAYSVKTFGVVNGEEFRPGTFERRGFSFLEVPLLRIQFTPVWHKDSTNDLERYLSSNKLYTKAATDEQRWDLVYALQFSRGSTSGGARILCQYLDAKNEDGDFVWLKWSEKKTEMAKVLWPAIADVAQKELYSFVPDLFVLGSNRNHRRRVETRHRRCLGRKVPHDSRCLGNAGRN